MMKRGILLITDTHLTEHSPVREVFRSLLEKTAASDYDVLFMGDIFDIWIGCSGYETEIHKEFMEWCRREKTKRNLWFLEGNHEFFIRRNRSGYFTEVFSHSALLDGGAFYAMHGDLVNYHDKFFTLLRASLRNPISYFLIRLFGYTGLGTAFSGKVRKDLRNTNQVQKHYYPREELLDLERTLANQGVKCAVAGHFHRHGQEGMITLLGNFTETDDTVGLYESGKGIRTFSAKEWIGETK